ncbi:MAG: hypothetical protein AB1521_06695 [Bacteroidota bacterium]
MLFKYFLLWFPMVIIAIVNGSIRQFFYTKFLNELAAHQVSVLSGIIFFAVYVWIITGVWKIESSAQAITIGIMWLAMTIIFEFVFGHFVMGNSWEKLLADYNIFKGRLWIVVLIWTAISPYIFFKLRS